MTEEQRQRLAAMIDSAPTADWSLDEGHTFTAHLLHMLGHPNAHTVMDLQWAEQGSLEDEHGLDGLMLARMETIEEEVTTAEEARQRLRWYVLDDYLVSCRCERCEGLRKTKGYAGKG